MLARGLITAKRSKKLLVVVDEAEDGDGDEKIDRTFRT